MTNIDICKQCYENRTSCCTLKSQTGEKMMIPPVSNAEIRQILHFFKQDDPEKFFELKINSTFYINQMLNLFPDREESIFKKFPENGQHFELKTKNDACLLLGKKGCKLPKSVRPHFCRIYPFWFLGESPHLFQDSGCLALQTCKTISEVFLSLGTNPEALKKIHSNICHDWGLSRSMLQDKVKFSL